MIYVRWRRAESRKLRVFPPLTPDNSLAESDCLFCMQPLGRVQEIQLIAVRPDPDDEEACAKHDSGRWHTCAAMALHKLCAEGMTDQGVELWIQGFSMAAEE